MWNLLPIEKPFFNLILVSNYPETEYWLAIYKLIYDLESDLDLQSAFVNSR